MWLASAKCKRPNIVATVAPATGLVGKYCCIFHLVKLVASPQLDLGPSKRSALLAKRSRQWAAGNVMFRDACMK